MLTEPGAGPTFRAYLASVRRRRRWVAGAAVLGLGAGLALSLTSAKQYAATADVLVQSTGQTSLAGTTPVTQTGVQTLEQLVTSAPVQEIVLRQLGSLPPVSVADVAQANMITVTAISTEPSRAAQIANAYAAGFVAYQQSTTAASLTAAEDQLQAQIRSVSKQVRALRNSTRPGAATVLTALLNQEAVLRNQLAQMHVNSAVATDAEQLVTPAQPPGSPSSPKPATDGLLGLTAGLLLGLAAAFTRDCVDDAVSTAQAAEHLGSAPVLAAVPLVTSWKKRDQPLVVSVTEPQSPTAESYRSLRTSLQFVRLDGGLRTLLVTSPAAGEGKTSTLANLGTVFAQAGERVLLVSCDLRRPRVGSFFGLSEDEGLTTVLLGQRSLADAVQPVPHVDRLWLLGAGPIPPNPAELLSSPAARAIFTELRRSFDVVLIDSPPVMPVTDAMVLSRYVDATLLVAAAGQTRGGDLKRAAEKFAQANAPVVGLVLNQVARQDGYGGRYGYSYGSYAREPASRSS